jgi:HEAT repeat protein
VGIRTDPGRLVFTRAGAEVLATSPESFLADPGRTLAAVSARSDRWALFRAFTSNCVLLAFPTALYVLLFALLRLAAAAVAGAPRADALAACACLLLGLGALAQVHFGRLPPPSPADLSIALASEQWQQRVAAMKEIRRRGDDICRLADCSAHAGSPHPQERYWLARALAASPSPAASGALLRLADDARLYVRTMALDGLARRGDRGAVGRILERLKTSPEWYVQLYAYQALKALGWHQPLSP